MELRGKHNTAIVYTDIVDQSAISQIINMCNQESLTGSNIRIMPDVHAGAGCTIGTTLTIHDKVIPNMVGVDIGCGMLTVKLTKNKLNLPELDSAIRKNVPSGFSVRNKEHKFALNINLSELICKDKVNIDRAYNSIGTLGGGNHFIEVDKGSDGSLYLVIHTGSRNLGKQIAEHYQNLAFEELNNPYKKAEYIKQQEELINKLKKEGKSKDIGKEVEKLKQSSKTSKVPKEMAYCEGKLMMNYLMDMQLAQEYASLNRKAIAQVILKEIGVKEDWSFETIHNYINIKERILRKGAVSAQLNERILIPINMRDGSLLCIGKGNPDWNYSAPHGAGRLMSRSEAKQNFSLSEYTKTMKEAGIFTTSVSQGTLDECPMAYKNIGDIVNNISDTAEIIDILKPIYNFKASDAE